MNCAREMLGVHTERASEMLDARSVHHEVRQVFTIGFRFANYQLISFCASCFNYFRTYLVEFATQNTRYSYKLTNPNYRRALVISVAALDALSLAGDVLIID